MVTRKMIMGRKVGMTQIFAADGTAVPVTILEVGPCYVVQRRTVTRDGYDAVQVGYMPFDAHDVKRAEDIHRLHEQRRANRDEQGHMKDRGKVKREPRGPHRLTLAQYGHFTKHGMQPLRFLKEFHVADLDAYTEGTVITASTFAAGDKVDISGTSKGRGFAGVMKRYGFKGGNETHGSMFHRKPASSGATDAARIFKNARRPGHMGAAKVTVKGLTVVRADDDKNMLVLKGAVPGPNGGLVVVTMPDRPVREHGRGRMVTFTALEGK
jgi:large subunit ribosomal protein L3